ncbi:glycosyltransferase family 4 protein [bacterium]|jgi:colanic acid biosynthesis glycosyl transferase WcaI|nr:glycosyltransferase family 4 protein [bacterium]
MTPNQPINNKTNLHKLNNDSLKLTIVSQLFYPELISTGQTIYELAEDLTKQNVSVDVICGPITLSKHKKPEQHINRNGIKINRIWGTSFPKLNFLGKLLNQLTFTLSVFVVLTKRRFTKQRTTPLLILTNPPMMGIAAAFQRIIGGSPYIYLIFDVYPETAIRANFIKRYGLISLIWTLSNSIILTYSSSIIVIGRCMSKLFENKAYSSKLKTIHVWADDLSIGQTETSSNKNDPDNPYIKKWNLKDKFVVMYSGNLARFHDLETIMEAADALKEHTDIVFLFVGEGHKKKMCVDIAQSKNLPNCIFDTYVPKDDLKYSLKVADIGLVSLLKGQEGLSVPSKTFGLLSAGIPILGLLPENSEISLILNQENCGKVVEPGNVNKFATTLLDLKNSPETLKTLSENGKKAIKEMYNLRNASKEYISILKSINIT